MKSCGCDVVKRHAQVFPAAQGREGKKLVPTGEGKGQRKGGKEPYLSHTIRTKERSDRLKDEKANQGIDVSREKEYEPWKRKTPRTAAQRICPPFREAFGS